MRWSLKRQSFCRSPSNRENFPRTGLASADLHRGNASDGPMRRLVAPGGLRCFNPCRLRGSAGQQIIVRRLLIVARTKEPIGRRQGTHSGERVSSTCSPLSPRPLYKPYCRPGRRVLLGSSRTLTPLIGVLFAEVVRVTVFVASAITGVLTLRVEPTNG